MYHKEYYVYILTNKKHSVFYTGMSSDIIQRIYEHKNKLLKGFTYKYNVTKLVYYEIYGEASFASAREHQIKKWRKQWKRNIINEQNPSWRDLYYRFL